VPIDKKLTKVFISIRGGLARAVSGIVPPKEIEDVVQETYVRVCQIRSDTEIKSPRSFMYKTARNIALNYMNSAESRLSSSFDQLNDDSMGDMQDPNKDTLRTVCSDEEFSVFCDAVRSLPVQCRRAFVLKKVYGHSYREIAATMQISEKTVEKHISKGIINCRKFMLNRNDSIEPDRKVTGQFGGSK
jgi:RNA polymerase sigma-70 factor (ECF subfamily)